MVSEYKGQVSNDIKPKDPMFDHHIKGLTSENDMYHAALQATESEETKIWLLIYNVSKIETVFTFQDVDDSRCWARFSPRTGTLKE